MDKKPIRNLTLSAMFLALGLVLPLLTGQIKSVGNMLLPMHIPVLLCGLICGWQYGLSVGLILPLLRSMIFGMPLMFPTAAAMAFELATYGFLVGLLYNGSRWKCLFALYRAMLLSMAAGRIVWGVVMVVMLGASGSAFTWKAFLSGALLNSIPGILIQLSLIPLIMVALDRTKLVPFHKKSQKQHENPQDNSHT